MQWVVLGIVVYLIALLFRKTVPKWVKLSILALFSGLMALGMSLPKDALRQQAVQADAGKRELVIKVYQTEANERVKPYSRKFYPKLYKVWRAQGFKRIDKARKQAFIEARIASPSLAVSYCDHSDRSRYPHLLVVYCQYKSDKKFDPKPKRAYFKVSTGGALLRMDDPRIY